MRPARRALALAALALTVAAPLVASGPAGAAAPARAAASAPRAGGYAFAVIGDVPYGADQVARFPGWIQQINADPQVRSVVHVGDIKNGSSAVQRRVLPR